MPRHPFDALSLVFGLIFGAVAAQIIDPRWLGPAILVIIGLVLLLPRRSRQKPPAPDEVGDGDHGTAI